MKPAEFAVLFAILADQAWEQVDGILGGCVNVWNVESGSPWLVLSIPKEQP